MRWSSLTPLLVVGAPLMFTACATMGPPQPPSLQLPKPPLDLRATRKGDRVILTWSVPSVTTDRQTIRGLGTTRICRGPEAKLTECGVPVGEVAAQPGLTQAPLTQAGLAQAGSTESAAAQHRPSHIGPSTAKSSKQKTAASYTDSLSTSIESDNPSSLITYAIEVRNTNGRGAGLSNQVRVSLVRTLPPPRDFSARVTGQGVVLSWTSDLPAADSTKSLRYVYRVYRRPEASQEGTLVGERPAGGEPIVTLVDSNIQWEKTYEYRAETVTVISQEKQSELQVEGDDTPEVKVFADDVFPPAVPAGLQAVFSGPGQKAFIDLVWAPVADVDLDGYNVYRREVGTAAVKVNVELVKTPAYRDVNVVAGKHYFYSVSAVDVRGNESARSEEAGESVP
jgi:hypothetical protein